MKIESNRDSTNENEQVIAYYRMTGKVVESSVADPLGYLEPHPTRGRIPTTATWSYSSSPKPYAVIIEGLGKIRTDWGED